MTTQSATETPALPDEAQKIYGVPASAQAMALARLIQENDTLIHVAANDRVMDNLQQALGFFAPHANILRFPAWDTMPYDRASPHNAIMAERIITLSTLARGGLAKPTIVLTTSAAIIQKLPPANYMKQALFTLECGKEQPPEAFVKYLVHSGYRRVSKAMETGEFALRGSIVDLIPPGQEHGMRIDWFGDEVETIRPFDPLSQVTQGNVDSLTLHPVSEVLLTETTVRQFRERYRELFGAAQKDDALYEMVSAMSPYAGIEHWLPLFYDTVQTLPSYLPAGTPITISIDATKTVEERMEAIHDYYAARTEALQIKSKKNSFSAAMPYHPVPPEDAFIMEAQWELLPRKNPLMQLIPFNAPSSASEDFGYKTQLPFAQKSKDATPFDLLRTFVHNSAEQSKKTLIACYSTGSLKRIQTLLLERKFHALEVNSFKKLKSLKGKTVGLAVLPIDQGFEADKVIFLSEQDVFGERITRAAKRKKKSDVFMQEAGSFSEGEPVVHKEHGIARFEGLVTVNVTGAAHDCLKLIYDGGDKLFLPVENIDLVSRYGADNDHVQLDKLGGTSWQMRKAKLKKRIRIAAETLLKTAAERQLRKAEVLDKSAAYEEFVSRFPFAETEDQQRAIDEVVEDLQSGTPMDRLICGDVGFGKTEVALRAAFIATSSEQKTQVALIAPTTLLARQHYKNFKERFEGFDITIRQLSRMVTQAKQKQTREDLAAGKVDIVIGTHALLSKQTKFKNLGLLIVDEEQHFGVGQKEKLKELKAGVHVLTLSATPIPRTLQMALTGVRDLSLITTPPVDRLAIRSFVMPFDPVMIKEAVSREIHRGGQCFVVTPRIKYMAELKAQIKELLPDARMRTAHGQMPAAELDEIMNDFYDSKFDILLSTAIIESGLDVPSANTIIVHNAHLFGLSQLYQMRGRVGRGKTRAYAYFLLPHHKELTKNATRRLEVMNTLDTLGAGFSLASHDMDIRGFGNMVGEEQSGHIKEVGVELYQHMLEEAVDLLKRHAELDLPDDNESPDEWSPQINLGLSVLIPESYIEDLSLRMGLYKRAAHLESEEEISSFAAELTDRFGRMPEETETFIATLSLKALCKKAGIERIDVGPKGAVFALRGGTFAKPEKLLTYLDKHTRTLRARPDQKIVMSKHWDDNASMLAAMKQLAGDMAALLD